MFLNARIVNRERSVTVALRICRQTCFVSRLKPGHHVDIYLMAKLNKGERVRLVTKRGKRWVAAPWHAMADLIMRPL